jgi:para-nitrobenzyl esterase
MRITLLTFLLFGIPSLVYSQCDGRYQDDIFIDSDVVTVEYSDVYDWSSSDSGLDMDIYLPQGDEFENRPLIIFAHGGSFYAGNKNNPEAIAFCRSFARKGYVTASIQYRLTSQLSLLDSNTMIQTVFNAISDMKAAVRYFKQDVSINNNTYGIDSSQVFIGGYSAGAVAAINLAFLNHEDEVPAYLQPFVDAAGGLEGSSGNPGYSSKPKAVISLAGAIYLKSFMDSLDPPIVSVHAQDDATVPYNCDHALGVSLLPILCGSGEVHSSAESLEINNDLYTFESGGHLAPVTSTNMSTFSVPFVADFLYSLLDCNQTIISVNESPLFTYFFYPNPTSGNITIETSQKDVDLKIYNALGKLVFSKKNVSSQQLQLNDLKSGIYSLILSSNNRQENRKLIVY